MLLLVGANLLLQAYPNLYIEYIVGIGEVVKVWLYKGCLESPEEMSDIIYEEYHIERF